MTVAPPPTFSPLFLDPALDREMRERSYVRLPALTDTEIAHLITGYHEIVGTEEDGVRLDYIRPDRDTVRRLTDLARPVFERVFADHFADRIPVLVSFIAKHPGEGTEFFLHRDIAANDERGGIGHTIWIPLVDVAADLHNGALKVVAGSERIEQGCTGVDASAALAPYDTVLRSRLAPVDLEAGTALVYPARLFHASDANRSDHVRLAVACMVAERGRPLVHVEPVGRRHRLVHRVDQDFFIDHHPESLVTVGIPEAYPVIEEFDEEPVDLPAAVAAGLGLATRPVPVPRLPPDIEVDPAGDRVVRLEPFVPRHHRDLLIGAHDLDPVEERVIGATASDPRGGVGARVLREDRRPVGRPPEALRDAIEGLDGRGDRHLALLVLDPWARVQLVLPRRRGHVDRLEVIEAPVAACGAVVGADVVALDPGTRLRLPAGGTVTIWNDGPGPVVVLLRTAVRGLGPRPLRQ